MYDLLVRNCQNTVAVGILLIIVATCALAQTLFSRRTYIHRLPLPSGAEFIWGHERKVFSQQPGRLYRNWTKELGLAFRIKAAFGAPDLLVLSDPVGIAHILQKKIFDYHHSQVVRPRIDRLLGKGLGWVEGQSEHKRMKRLVSSPLKLSAESIRRMSAGVRDAASRVLEDLIDDIQSSDGIYVSNMLDWTSKTTLSVVGRVAFHHDFEGGTSPDAYRILHGRRQGVAPIAKYSGFLTLMLLRRFPILNLLPIFAIQSQGIAKRTIQSGVAKEMVRRSKGLLREHLEDEGEDLLTTLLKAAQEGKVSDEELFEHISTFVMTGHEATTLTLGFTIWELSRNPHIQQRLRMELQAFSVEPTYDDYLTKLPYLDAVLKETLRLYPGLPYMERVATKHDVIPLGKPINLDDGKTLGEIEILPGQTIVIPIIAIQRSDAIWKDADTFRPERWLEELPPQELLCSGWSNLLVFSDGPRSCIGARLAIFQYKVIISQFVQKLRFEPTGEDICLKINSSIQPMVVGRETEGSKLPVQLHLL